MIDKLQMAVSEGEKHGARFVEARYDDLLLRTLQRTNDTWKDILTKIRSGIGIMCYYEGASGYAFTASTEVNDIKETAKKAFKLAQATASAVKLRNEFDNLPSIKSGKIEKANSLIKIHPSTESLDFKINLVDRTIDSAREHGKNITNISGYYGELYGNKFLVNSDGSDIKWEFEVVDLLCIVTAKTDEGNLVTGVDRFGGTRGLEIFSSDKNNPEIIGEKAGKWAKEQLKAKACPAGKFRALVDEQLTGVLAHESFGHLSEADFVIVNASPLTGKLGQKLGTEHVTILDSGTPDITKYGGLWVPYDDQGIKGGDTIILEKGILKNYLQNRGTAQHLHQEPTGNCRALHFGFPPIPRMTNTYFMPGELTEDEALEQLDIGIYALQTSGGQVQGDGNFLFKAERGYWVENGEKKYPLREVSLTGNILDLLLKVEGATKELKFESGYFGGCGKRGQAPLPVGSGGSNLLISEVIFGGKA